MTALTIFERCRQGPEDLIAIKGIEAHWFDIATSGVTKYGDEPGGNEAASAIEEYTACATRYKARHISYLAECDMARVLLGAFPKTDAEILRLYYMDRKDIPDISVILEMSERSITRHKRTADILAMGIKINSMPHLMPTWYEAQDHEAICDIRAYYSNECGNILDS